MFNRKLVALLAVLAMLFAACGGDDEADTTTADGGDGGGEELVVGVSWNNYNEERWAKSDEPAIKAALEAEGIGYTSTDAGSSAEQQIADVETMIAAGVDALIILAQDGTAILPAVQAAIAEGIPVIAYDRLIEDPSALYITFDNVEVGRMQAREILKLVPEGNYVFIKGNQADANADFLRGGQQEILQEAIDSGAIVNVGEQYTDNWDPAVAQTNMEQILTQNDNAVDAVVASNDGTAGGVVAALAAQGMVIPVSGQDGDAAALNRVALGSQSVSVWKDARELGKAAGTAAAALAQGTALGSVSGTQVFDSPGGNSMTSILLAPIPITNGNLSVVLDAGWIDEATLCQGVASGSVDGCP
ncbi:MAG: substrate-binding domain-containing protein [Acidimicrobiia bacterium]|nr:substrate-binding domain-containing protein [Acidimicrobiia bacterium]MDX2466381.1 substrate-binding domain-containing protein [Acidimicrobiia bacterium]